MDEKKHYVCKSCGGVTVEPKTCSTGGCDKKGEPLDLCECGDKSSHEAGCPGGDCSSCCGQ